MFHVMNENEMMNVEGGNYAVPAYDEYGKYLGIGWVPNDKPGVKKIIHYYQKYNSKAYDVYVY